jgi:predicted ATPase
MALTQMALTNYRCFAQGIDVELRPLTIILGKNNSGKSALVRAPVLCNTGIATDSSAPLDLDLLGEDMLQSFTDLIYGNRPHGNIGIELRFTQASPPLQLRATVQNIDEYRTQLLTFLELKNGDTSVKFTWIPADSPENVLYVIDRDGQVYENIRVSFGGLLPTGDLEPEVPELTGFLLTTSEKIRNVFPLIRYFGPFRDRPARLYRLPARMPGDLGVSGEHAAAALASDFARQQGQLIQQVNELLQPELSGWRLNVTERAGMYSIVLRFQEDDSLVVNLADVGTGVAQVLPILVRRAIDILDPPSVPVLEIVEQPELHLHPAAHGGLADIYIAASKRPNIRFMIETHSETFLLRVRRRIAEGSLDPGMLAVYFLENADGEATARSITVAEDGSLDYWPRGIFSEDYEEARAITKAQAAKEIPNAT